MTADRPNIAPDIDKDPKLRGNDLGTEGHYSGEEYDSDANEQPRYVEVGASRSNRAVDPTTPNGKPGEDIPPDAGKRAYIDEKTGEVHGSGAGAGGGTGAEDYDLDSIERGTSSAG